MSMELELEQIEVKDIEREITALVLWAFNALAITLTVWLHPQVAESAEEGTTKRRQAAKTRATASATATVTRANGSTAGA